MNAEVRIHPTALVEEGVELGEGTVIWDHAHLRGPCRIGRHCVVGGKSYIAYGVEIADRVKINAFVYVCTGVTVESGAMLSAGVTFTNDRFPRATDPELTELRPSEPDEDTLSTLVRAGATIGARSVIGPGVEIGRFAMIGMGSVVTRSVPDHHLAVGNPAKTVGAVCRCGHALLRVDRLAPLPQREDVPCPRCRRRYDLRGGHVLPRDEEPLECPPEPSS